MKSLRCADSSSEPGPENPVQTQVLPSFTPKVRRHGDRAGSGPCVSAQTRCHQNQPRSLDRSCCGTATPEPGRTRTSAYLDGLRGLAFHLVGYGGRLVHVWTQSVLRSERHRAAAEKPKSIREGEPRRFRYQNHRRFGYQSPGSVL